jgi:6-pyruvoyltetrahydropterin/6-carboxytetrahydropterin synthase
MWKIAKQFDFCYGHRVWNQTLNTDFSIDGRCVCRHLHGHQGTVKVFLEGDELTAGMVTDFKHLNWLKKFLDDVLDHKFIIDKNDPMIDAIIPFNCIDGVEKRENGWVFDGQLNITTLCFTKHFIHNTGYSTINTNLIAKQTPDMQDILEGFVIVDFIPTSENLSKWICDIANAKMNKIGVKVSRVQFFETPKSQANYYV